MTKLLQIGIAYAAELGGIGHVCCTLGGVNYESRGDRGCLRGSSARGATNPVFRHRFHTTLTDAQASGAKRYADGCVGQPYVWGAVPSADRGGDDSGLVSAIICAAEAKPIHRLFHVDDWATIADRLGFVAGLGGNVTLDADQHGVADRPYPGYPIVEHSPKPGHVRWIQARLNHAAHGPHHLTIDGTFGPLTLRATIAFQNAHGLPRYGRVGPQTWAALNRVR